MAALTIIVAPQGSLQGVRDALRDWSAEGLIDRFHWVEPHMVASGAISALRIQSGEMSGVNVQQLAGRAQQSVIRIAALVPLLHGVETADRATEEAVVRMAEASFGNSPVTRVRIIVARADSPHRPDEIAVEGWHNVVLSPEDSVGPGVGRAPLLTTGDEVELGAHTAAAVAGLLGLWTGAGESMLDSQGILPGRTIRLARFFYRRLDSTRLEADLRRQVLDTERAIPLPTHYGSPILSVSDAGLAATEMAGNLWQRHAAVLKGPREESPRSKATTIGALAALKMFFGFLGAALRNAPRAWAAGVINSVRSQTAAAVHGMVFGAAPSAYAVVVKGVTADGMPASWLDYSEAIASLDRIVDDPASPREHVAATNLAGLWRDYAAAALTLADGGERVAGLPPIQVGAQRAVVRRSGQIVPVLRDGYAGVPPHLAAAVGDENVAPFDVLGAWAVEQRLRKAAEQPTVGVAAASALTELSAWKGAHFESFAARVGTRIGESLFACTAEIKAYLDTLRNAADPDDLTPDINASQRRLARLLRIIGVVALALIAVIAILFATDVVSLESMIGVIVGLVIGWFIVSLLTFLRGQQRLFHLMNARAELMGEVEAARRNLRHATADARRLADAYSQFLAWSRVLGAFLEAPFGREPDSADHRGTRLTGLPISTRIGEAAVDETAVASAAHEIRRGLFAVGWLSECWDGLLESAHRRVGPRGVELRDDVDVLFSQPGTGEDSLLPQWVDAVERDGGGDQSRDVAWNRVLDDLAGSHAPLAASLLSHVSEDWEARVAAVPYEQFVGHTDEGPRLIGDRLDDSLLVDSARVGSSALVDVSLSTVSEVGLGRVILLAQVSSGIPEYSLAILASNHGRPATPVKAERVQDDEVKQEPPAPFGGLPF